ncbi:MAG TPA: SDR family NAD(P)-dependent oxidoreductase [Moraxellaceae bacterium]|nr:SDR family NAD(P)-dependent oxidoreductase [Moraxellaceae bacterium]
MTSTSPAAIIVGASRGIGAALAHELAARGYRLGLLSRNQELLQVLAGELTALHHGQVEFGLLDVTDQAAVGPALDKIIRRLGDVDLIIANAGISGARKAGDGNLAKDRRIIETNLMGAIAVIDAAVAYFRQRGSGHIAAISSSSAYLGIPGSGAYSASKAALTNYLEALRMELADKPITVSIVHPGFVKTDIAPHMEKYPFVAAPEKVAREIVEGLLRRRKNLIVPALPWRLLLPALKLLPDKVMRKVF